MKYSCDVIKDLLPLYHDEVCSEDTKKLVEDHLAECEKCGQFYEKLLETDTIEEGSFDPDEELRKASFLQNIRQKFARKQILTGLMSALLLLGICAYVIGALSRDENVVEYHDNISVYMMDHDLIGRLQGSHQNQMHIKRVTVGEENYLFFCVYDTKWASLITNHDVFSEFVLCQADKSVESINKVYYFTGDYTGLESMGSQRLKHIIDQSILLWSK